ncbi:MAG TPA: ANTAR domain-containing protein [Pseudonocardiaceae bacterium]|nr:ANTAR domain-containing protein [Pseudonocardiaceae bacterium]
MERRVASADLSGGDRESEPAIGPVAVVRLAGEIDLTGCADVDRRLRGHTGRVVVDLSAVTLLSAAALGLLIAHDRRLSEAGGRLLVVAGTDTVRRVLRVTLADDVLSVHATVADAVAACADDPTEVANDRFPVRVPGGETRRLRRRLRSQPTIARALGVLQERYDLSDADVAFEILRDGAQRHNLRLAVLAAGVLSASSPKVGAQMWFPGRRREIAPPLRFAGFAVAREGNRTAVLDAVLDAMSVCLDTEIAEVQMIDAATGELCLERHRGLSAEVVDLVDSPAYTALAPAVAVRRRARVVVPDVASAVTDPVVRTVLLAGRCRTLHSSPLPGADGRAVGVASTHHFRPGRTLSAAEESMVDRITGEAGAWLEWHRRTIVLDALEQVHQAARLRPDSAGRP